MKKFAKKYVLFLIAAGLLSCSREEPVPQPESFSEVTILTADIQTKAVPVPEFSSGASMNIFAKTYGSLDAPDIVSGVVAEFDGTSWSLAPPVRLTESQKNAFIWACSPSSPENTDPERIRMDIRKQEDWMYSGAFVPASYESPAVRLKMSHALSLLSFNICLESYSGSGNVESVSLENAPTAALLNVSTGAVTPSEYGTVESEINKEALPGGWKSEIPGVWSAEFSGFARIRVDGTEYSFRIPAEDWKYGYRYLFRLVLTDAGLAIDPESTVRTSLNELSDEFPEVPESSVLKILSSGPKVQIPEIQGDNVFGTVEVTESGVRRHEQYGASSEVSGEAVTIEAWNASGFVLPSLEGVLSIDASKF